MKYVPPPDLTSNSVKAYPEVQTVFPPQNIYTAPPTILNPYESEGFSQNKNISEQQIGSSNEQIPTSEQLSRNSSLHSSFRSSPVAAGLAYNSPLSSANQIIFHDSSSVPVSSQFASSPAKPIPSRLLEPATPQNTPANVSFPSYVPYLNRDLPLSNTDKEVAAIKSPNQLNSPPKFTKDGILETTVESTNKPSSTSEETDVKFIPISAAQVTEKLKHILEEREKNFPHEASSEASSEIDEITSNVAIELAKSCEQQSETPRAANDFIERPYEAGSNNTPERTVHPASNTLNDVFLGQKSTALSVTRPEVYRADNNFVPDIQTVRSNSNPSEYYSQVQSTSIPCSIFQQTDKPADQKSSLNDVPFVQPSQENVPYVPPRPTEQSVRAYFESITRSTDRFPSPSSQENNLNPPIAQSVTDATNSRSTVSSNQSTPDRPPLPKFYNLADFAENQLLQQPTFPYTPNQHPAQQQPSQIAPLYESTSGFQQLSAVHENSNTAYPLPVVSMTTVPEPTGSATLSPVQMSTNSLNNRSAQDTIPPSFQNLVRYEISLALYFANK